MRGRPLSGGFLIIHKIEGPKNPRSLAWRRSGHRCDVHDEIEHIMMSSWSWETAMAASPEGPSMDPISFRVPDRLHA